jgi:hypothetical protein
MCNLRRLRSALAQKRSPLVAWVVAGIKAESGEVVPIILWKVLNRPSSPYRIRYTQISHLEKEPRAKSSTRNESMEHTIEKENPKHSPAQNVMTSKRAT